MSERYDCSERLLERALRSIPLGSQTFSKSMTQFPRGVSPYFLSKGQGSRVWDVDGNEYIDLINSLAAVTLGYNDPDVNEAVQMQLTEGVIFSLSHPIEMQVAETIKEMVPCAELVRFGKNGSDATAGAIRVSRAYTGRDHVAVCGYHGWQDWYIGSTTRNLGVPRATSDLTHTFMYNNIESLHEIFRQWPDQIAAVILEPMNVVEPADSFLEEVQVLAKKYGAVLVFDETITGFRFANGGAQAFFGVTPDLATFGKGLANGYPVSAVVGKAEIMKLMEEIFFSFTFGGETLSLAAALATMNKLQREPVVDTLYQKGQMILDRLKVLIQKHEIEHIVELAGHPSWSFFMLQDVAPYSMWEIKTLFMQEMIARGILTFGTHNVSYAMTDEDLTSVVTAYDEVLYIIKDAINNQKLKEFLRCEPLEPLFKVR
ncbi:glutamate-1-semialdehyde 2,1-aminomutase [Geothermobacter ehrlichii]|uniref:Glutamate-1-semialdehyde 2,1-aminomutase n=1 Tax=Geothermobacter ehrlichii TaxID=213224 RepID=A0A5D3WLI2_9BACT|nr:aminotransferase class III-fold pyridoxal phosphate-dependent enzyme [Geothermobacter ehrlichii]TYO98363.1 glutamate-1-semialdehyde 2,1-aminomutase [Geothermobacter ehrlichii]